MLKKSTIYLNDQERQAESSLDLLRQLNQKEAPKEMKVSLEGINTITLKGDKGDPGESIVGPPGPPGRSVIGPMGPEGKKGDKGDTPNIDKVANLVQSRINLDKVAEKASKLVKPKDGKDGSPDSPDEIIKKINESKKKIDPRQIKGLDAIIETVSSLDEAGKYPVGGGQRGDNVRYKDLTNQVDSSTKTFSLTNTKRVLGVFGSQFPVNLRPDVDWTFSTDTQILTLTDAVEAPQTGQTLWILRIEI